MIEFYGIKRFYEKNKLKINEIFKKTLTSGKIFDEEVIEEFEIELSKYCGRKYCITFSCCTDALICAADILGLRKRKILVPAYSFVATVTPFKFLECELTFYDQNPKDFTINFYDLESKLDKENENIVVIVHLYGYLNDFKTLYELQKKYKITYIEDFAQSLGSKYNELPAGSVGLISCVSFDPSKIIHAFGTGGALLTDDYKLYEKAKKYKYHGKINNNFSNPTGFNSRITAYQAELLKYQLKNIENYISLRNQIANIYISELKNIPQIKLPEYNETIRNNFHKFVIMAKKRNELYSYLKENNIETKIHYGKIIPDYEAFKEYKNNSNFNIKSVTSQILSLPIYPYLKTEEIDYIIKKIKNFYK